jgi:hypothetical protein
MISEAKKNANWIYTRVDSAYSAMAFDFDLARFFIQKEQMPVIIGLKWWSGWNGIKNYGKIDYPTGSKSWGHAMLCIGWDDDYYILVDSYDRIIYLHRRNKTYDIWGILREDSINKYHLKLKEPRKVRDIKAEQRNAIALKNQIYKTYAWFDTARTTAFQHWFLMIDALTYNGYTLTDVMNWVYAQDRHKDFPWDISQPKPKK